MKPPREQVWANIGLTNQMSHHKLTLDFYDGFINAKLSHFCYEHFVVYPVKGFRKFHYHLCRRTSSEAYRRGHRRWNILLVAQIVESSVDVFYNPRSDEGLQDLG